MHRFQKTRWTDTDSTNSRNREQYLEAHLEALAARRDGPDFEDDRPLVLATAGPSRNSPSPTDAVPEWGVWDAPNDPHLRVALERIYAQSAADAGRDERLLPPPLHRRCLQLLLPAQHRAVTWLHKRESSGEFKAMVGDGRKLTLKLLNDHVRPCTRTAEQQARVLGYALHVVRPLLRPLQALTVYQQLVEGCEATTPDHLAILTCGVHSPEDREAAALRSAVRDELTLHSGRLPVALAGMHVTSAALTGGAWQRALATLQSTQRPLDVTEHVWARAARRVHAEVGSLEAVQAVVDVATASNERMNQSLPLWNAYVAAAPLPHAMEMLDRNMPARGLKPNLYTLAAIAGKVGAADWQLACDLHRRATALNLLTDDPLLRAPRHHFLKQVLASLKGANRQKEWKAVAANAAKLGLRQLPK